MTQNTSVQGRQSFVSRVMAYGVGTTLYKLHVLALIPLFSFYLPQSENGAIEVANFGGGLIGAMAMLTLVPVASNRHTNAAIGDRSRVLGESAIAMTALAGLVLVLAPLLAWVAAFGLGSIGDRYVLVAVTFMAAALSAYVANMAYLLQLRSSRRAYSVIYASWALLVLGLTVVALVVLDSGAIGFATANLIAGIICSAMCAWTVRDEIAQAGRVGRRSRHVAKLLRDYVLSSTPLLPVTFLSWILLFADRRILEANQGLAAVGVYGLAVKIAAGVTVLLAPVTAAWWDRSMNTEDAETAQAARRTVDAMVLIAVVGTFAFVIARLAGLQFLLGEEYHDSLKYTALLSIASTLTSLFFVPFAFLTRQGRFVAVTLSYVVASVASIGLNLALTGPLGIAGATIANVAAYGVLVISGCWLVRRQLRIALAGRGWIYAVAFVTSLTAGTLLL